MSDNALGPLLESIYGTLYIGTVMSTAFYGVTCMQTFFYYVHYPNDPMHVKIFVAVFWALDTIHEALSISSTYKLIIAGLMKPLSFVHGNPELVLLYLLTAVIAITTQSFFVYRIYIFSRKNIIAPLIWVSVSVVALVCMIVFAGKALYSADGVVHSVDLTVFNTGIFETLGILALSIGAGVDVIVAIFMTYLLVREQAVTRFARTAHVLQLLTVFAVNTGIWTATFALLTIILLHLFPTKVFYAVFVIPLGSVYCNTLLANLNARIYIQGQAAFNVGMDLFTRSSSRALDSIDGDKQLGTAKLVNPAHKTRVWKTTEVLTLPDANRPISAIMENDRIDDC